MLKLLVTALLLSSTLEAGSSNADIEKFLKKSFEGNPNIVSLDVKVKQKVLIKQIKGWEAFIVSVDATVKAKPKNRKVKQKMIWFSNGVLMTQDFIDMKSGKSLKDLIAPSFKKEYYKKENLISGDENSKHKVAIFSDPQCPFCKTFVPAAIETMKKQPKKFAVYYYHFPLPALHPAAVELVKAAVAAELKGEKDVVSKMYKVKVSPNERDVKKILKAFNKTMKTDITPEDLKSKEVLKHIKSDADIADALMVGGTPTMFFDGKIDKSKRKFEKVK
ncbi:MAG: thioredoxin domain-containing protein [Campylobacterota bacterium]|nr:thioredoxin domain-containing protein [Campylobacterota bacterium]